MLPRGSTAKAGSTGRVDLGICLGRRRLDPDFDQTENLEGLGWRSIIKATFKVPAGSNLPVRDQGPWASRLHVIKEDSMKARLLRERFSSFGFADGNHDRPWVKSDFRLIWSTWPPAGGRVS